jgi:hypothetical protein
MLPRELKLIDLDEGDALPNFLIRVLPSRKS